MRTKITILYKGNKESYFIDSRFATQMIEEFTKQGYEVLND